MLQRLPYQLSNSAAWAKVVAGRLVSRRQSSGSTPSGAEASRARSAVTVTGSAPLGDKVTRSARTVSTTGRLGRFGRAGRVNATSPNSGA